MSEKCWICTGTGRSLCKSCNAARRDRMAKYNIDSDTAICQLREIRLEEEAEQAAQDSADSPEEFLLLSNSDADFRDRDRA